MLGMGMTLKTEDFVRVWKEPGMGVAPSSSLCQPGVPDRLFNGVASGDGGWIDPSGLLPGGTASTWLFFWPGKGGSVGVVSFLDPRCNLDDSLLTSWYAGHYLPVDPWALFKDDYGGTASSCGWRGVNRFFAKSARRASAYSPLVSVLLILLIVGFVLAAKRTLILDNWVTLLISVLFLHAGAFSGFLDYSFVWIEFGSGPHSSIEVGMQNSGLGTSLATDYWETSMVAAPCALSAVMHCLIGGLLAIRWRRNSDPEE